MRRMLPSYLRSTHRWFVAAKRMTSSGARARRGTDIGSTRLRIVTSWDPASMRARCGASAWPISQVKISGSAAPKVIDRREHRKLVGEHVLPHRLQIDAVKFERFDRRQGDALVGALLLKNVAQHSCRWPSVPVPIEIHHVVEIARTGSLGQRAHLLPERLLIGVAVDPQPFFGSVGIRMEDFAPDGGQDESLVRREVELDLWPSTCA